MGNGQKKDIAINLHSFTDTDGLPFKKIKRDGEEFLDVLAGVETDHRDEDTRLLVYSVSTALVQSVNNEQLLVAECHSILIALLWELYLL